MKWQILAVTFRFPWRGTCGRPFTNFLVEKRGEGGLLRISSDGGDRRIFLGLKFAIPGFFGVGKFGKYFFNLVPRSHSVLHWPWEIWVRD